MFVNIIEVQ